MLPVYSSAPLGQNLDFSLQTGMVKSSSAKNSLLSACCTHRRSVTVCSSVSERF